MGQKKIFKGAVDKWLKTPESMQDFADRIGVHQSSVSKYLKYHGIEYPRHKFGANSGRGKKGVPPGQVGVCTYIDQHKGYRFVEVYSGDFDIKENIIKLFKRNKIQYYYQRLMYQDRVSWRIRIRARDQNHSFKNIKHILRKYYKGVTYKKCRRKKH